MKGFVLVDKQKGISSFAVVKDVRKRFNVRKVGHAGTLDPLASGLMLVAVGEGTKLLEYFLGMEKEYLVQAHFGYVTETFDAEGELIPFASQVEVIPTKEQIRELIAEKFLGKIAQVPPKFSAIKIAGKKAYQLARKGEALEMKARNVVIKKFEQVGGQWPIFDFKVTCSSGTYIRSLIADLGEALGVGAYVKELRRTKIADYSVAETDDDVLIPLEKMVRDFDRWDLDREAFDGLSNGKIWPERELVAGEILMAFYEDKLVGIVEKASGGGVKYRKVIH